MKQSALLLPRDKKGVFLKKGLFLVLLLVFQSAFSAETCSRTAVINYQEVLIDNNSSQKGEGLRYYLEKDEIAKKYLDTYQEGLQRKTLNAVIGTIGTLILFSGLLVSDSSSRKRSLLIGGGSIVAINFLVAKTIEHNNENNLRESIEEYNKRNLPRIYFNTMFDNTDKYLGNKLKGFGLSMVKNF